jgi:MarR family transcriptional regulator, organic hydroperoxide resistance regulator
MGISSRKQANIGRIINSIRAINKSIQCQSKELEKSFHVTGPQLGALRVIDHLGEPSLKELSEKMYLHVSTVSGIIDRLEAGRYLTRYRNGQDRRAINIRLTDKGTKLIKEAPLSGLGGMIRDLQKLPAPRINQIGRSVELLSRLMNIEENDMKSIS